MNILLINLELVHMNNLHHLSDKLLMETYQKAIRLSLDKDFITILEKEIKRRRLPNNRSK